LSKILEEVPPKRFPFWIEYPDSLGVLELVALAARFSFSPSLASRAFLILPDRSVLVNSFVFRPKQAGFIRLFSLQTPENSSVLTVRPSPKKARLRTNLSMSYQRIALEPLEARKGFTPRVLQWVVLCGIPYRGRGLPLTQPYEPCSPSPLRAGLEATGKFHRCS